MKDKIQNLEINLMELKKDISAIKEALVDNKNEHKELLNRIDGFIKTADERFADKTEHKETIQQIKDFPKFMDEKYVSKESFGLIQKIVYGMVGAILVAFLGALLLNAFK